MERTVVSSMWRIVLAVAITALATRCAWSAEPYSRPESADQRVEAALRRELAGDNAQRDSLLHKALVESPDHAPARWQSGQVRSKEWMSVAAAERQARGDRCLAEYRQLRAAAAWTVADQAALARWCRKNRLEDEQRVHWLLVLKLQPDNAEAIAALRLKPYLGTLMTRDQIQQAKKQLHDVHEAEKRWRPLVGRWRGAAAADRQSVLADLGEKVRAISQPAEMLALERAVWQQTDGQRKSPSYHAMTLELIRTLADNPRPAASESLARHAAFSKFDDVRDAAIRALAPRPLDHYVPQLLSALRSPVEEEVRYRITAGGHLASQYSLFEEGPLGNLRSSLLLSPVVQNEILVVNSAPSGESPSLGAEIAWQNNAAASIAQANRDSESFRAAVDRMNREIRGRNARVTTALAKATGRPPDDEPMKWWKWWWQDYNEQYSVDGRRETSSEGQPRRPEYENKSAYDYPVHATPPEVPSGPSSGGGAARGLPSWAGSPGSIEIVACSCFARGTKVWTLMGRTPIEDVRIGDRVLAQDSESGELAYKPVLGVTLRPPGPRLKIGIRGDTITATPSHPFWVVGQGWRMTKHLHKADSLHSISGSMPIETIEPVEAPLAHYEVAYNLIVADFCTYFVGERGILVHDNTPRRPTASLVPGLPMQEADRHPPPTGDK